MGDFDDVLAMEPGDEWDDHDSAVGAGPPARREPPVAELHAPAATIELRGEVPGELMDALGPLRALPAPVSPHRAVATLEVAPTERDQRWGLIDHDGGEVGLTGTAAELAAVLGDRLVDMARTADARHLVLPFAGVQLGDGRGVVVLDDDFNTFQHVVETLVRIIPAMLPDKAWELAHRIDGEGSAVVWCGPQEQAELYHQQLGAAGLTMAPLERA
jgi:ATP-dependent Clp protease adaptor protein ClpS